MSNSSFATLPPPDNYATALRRERLDATILRSLGERRALRQLRTAGPSAWDELEGLVMGASTVAWETADASSPLHEDVLAFCAFLARELAVTEGLDLPYEDEVARLQELAPRALAALDEIAVDSSAPQRRALAVAFRSLRAALLEAQPMDAREAA